MSERVGKTRHEPCQKGHIGAHPECRDSLRVHLGQKARGQRHHGGEGQEDGGDIQVLCGKGDDGVDRRGSGSTTPLLAHGPADGP